MKILLVLLCLGGMCFGQENKVNLQPSKYYRLYFTVKEIDSGKVINIRSYSLSIVTPAELGKNGEIRAGEKIPFQTNGAANQIEVGVNIDCRNAKEVGDRLNLNVSAEISSVAASEEKGGLPVIRETRMNTFVSVAMKKATLILSSDEPSSKSQLQVELTATPLD